ncbi:MAG: phenylalanine--tRNA ligase beta subunit-related protein [Candidatus Micrarchaeota archaeon]
MERFIFAVDEGSRERLKGLALGYLLFTDVRNEKANAVVGSTMEATCNAMKAKFKDQEAILEDTIILATRKLFSSIGRDPTKERPSGEALIRRVVIGKGIYRISAVVDINNIVSLLTGFPCGVYDAGKIEGSEITVLLGAPGTEYEGLGGRPVEAANRLLTADQKSIFGGPTADSARTQVTAETKSVLMLIYCPPGIELPMLKATLEKASKLMGHGTGAKEAHRGIFVVE